MSRVCSSTFQPAGRGREYQKCIALAEPGLDRCVLHLKRAGWSRCACGGWMEPAGGMSRIHSKCRACGAIKELGPVAVDTRGGSD